MFTVWNYFLEDVKNKGFFVHCVLAELRERSQLLGSSGTARNHLSSRGHLLS